MNKQLTIPILRECIEINYYRNVRKLEETVLICLNKRYSTTSIIIVLTLFSLGRVRILCLITDSSIKSNNTLGTHTMLITTDDVTFDKIIITVGGRKKLNQTCQSYSELRYPIDLRFGSLAEGWYHDFL